MDKVKEAIQFLNPSQSPMLEADQPLYALAKHIQWCYPEEYGEFVIVLGGLHTEMAILNMIGKLLKGSQWTLAIEESEVATAGAAKSFLNASHVTKTRRAFQVTACSFYKLLKMSFHDDCDPSNTNNGELQDWCETKSANHPTSGL